jgi:hypothetical protein
MRSLSGVTMGGLVPALAGIDMIGRGRGTLTSTPSQHVPEPP